MNKKTLFSIIFILVIVVAIVLSIFVTKYNKKEESETEKPTEEKPVDVSNITDNIVIDGATRNMDVMNEEDAAKIISEMYIKSMDTYGFSFDTEENEDGTEIVLVGYNEILNNIFTNNGIKQFEEYYSSKINKVDNKVYIQDKNLIKDELNYSLKIIEKEISEKKIIAKVRVTYNDVEKEDATFSIEKIDNIWKVESFVCPF